ncbi:MAG: hypothetical protein F6K50_14060 [Moorea sp. SIO3I7]|nr:MULTISPECIES: hypothetical protein [unclassified Moorena]NEN96615.1 hypothetical protein [Moorena sp. SIO3I7]NEO20584.1 hypothetical protein [Moorena sp. SIO4A5]NEQ58556.1 hypothetical protein [Moorena sp. SIO4A1]
MGDFIVAKELARYSRSQKSEVRSQKSVVSGQQSALSRWPIATQVACA